MTYIIIGNIFGFIASIFMVYSGIVKEKNKVLFYQTLEVGIAVISYIFLGGISGAIINALNVLRNILCYKDKLNVIAKLILSILSAVLVLYFNNYGLIGVLPLICILIYLWCMTIKDVVKFKILIIVLMILWTVYDFTIKSYVASVFDVLTIIANIISIIRIKSRKR